MKKILIILNDLKNGGVERVLSVLANYFADKGYDVNVLAIRTKDISYPISKQVHYEFCQLRPDNRNETLREELKMEFFLFRYMKELSPDVLIGFDDSIIIRTVPIAWLLGIKTIVSERIDPSKYGRIMQVIRQVAYDMATKVVFQTPDARNYFPPRTRKKSVVIPNPLTENLPQRSQEINKDILMACRIRPQKNIGLAIRAFAKFWETHRDYRLKIYGDGELVDKMQQMAVGLGVSANVDFPGHVDDIHNRMSHCAMYLSSSDYEGISNSMLEAMAIGVPCVCTDCPVGGASMFIENGENGVLVPVNDVAALSAAMEKVIDDVSFASSISRNSTKVKDTLAVEKICPQWEKLL